MTYDSGTGVAKYLLDISQVKRAAAELRAIFTGIRQQETQIGRGGAGGGGGAFTQQSAAARRALADFERLERQYNAVRDSEIRAARAAGDHAKALQLIDAQLRSAQPNTVRYNNLLAQQAQVQRQAAANGGLLKDQLLGMVGPAALVAGGLAVATRAVQSFAGAFTFKAQLDATKESIEAQLAGVRDSGRVFREAQAFADRYRLTQAQTTEILQNSVGVLRTSASSVGDLEAALLRLQSRDPSKSIGDASRALRELASGDTQTIKEVFNVGAQDARRMKEEIAGGADAVQVLTRFLDQAGNGMDVLERRTRGVQGAFNERARAEEELALAQAQFAQGPGLRILQVETNVTAAATRLLTGDLGTMGLAIQEAGNRGTVLSGVLSAMAPGFTIVTQAAAEHTRFENQLQAAIAATTAAVDAARPALQGLAAVHGETAGAAGVQAQAERALANELGGVQRQAIVAGSALAAMRRIEAQNAKAKQEAIKGGIGRASDVLGGGFGDTIKEEEGRIRQARLQLALTQAKTDAQKIALLQKELNRTTDAVERIHLQTQIASLQQAGTSRVSAATRTADQLATVEENSGLQLARIQRENLERLRDQQEDFEVDRTRKVEDFNRERQRLLARGERAAAARLTEDFARDQRRAQEDFNRQRRRTSRNNEEGVGDLDARTDLRQQQIIGRGGGGTILPRGGGGGLPALPGGGGAAGAPRTLQLRITAPISINGKVFAEVIWPDLEPIVDGNFAEELATISTVLPPGSTQTAVAGA